VSEEQDKQKNSEKRRQSQMEAFEKNIAQWQHELENPPEVEDIAVILEELVCLCFVFVFIGVSGADGSGSSSNEMRRGRMLRSAKQSCRLVKPRLLKFLLVRMPFSTNAMTCEFSLFCGFLWIQCSLSLNE